VPFGDPLAVARRPGTPCRRARARRTHRCKAEDVQRYPNGELVVVLDCADLEPTTGIARWLRDVADPQMDRLRDRDRGPFRSGPAATASTSPPRRCPSSSPRPNSRTSTSAPLGQGSAHRVAQAPVGPRCARTPPGPRSPPTRPALHPQRTATLGSTTLDRRASAVAGAGRGGQAGPAPAHRTTARR